MTGIGVLYDEVVPFSDLNESGSILATGPLAALVDRANWNFEGAFVDAEPGTDLAELTAAIEALGQRGRPRYWRTGLRVGPGVGHAAGDRRDAAAGGRARRWRPPPSGSSPSSSSGRPCREPAAKGPSEVDALRAIGSRPGDRLAFAAGPRRGRGIGRRGRRRCRRRGTVGAVPDRRGAGWPSPTLGSTSTAPSSPSAPWRSRS